MNRTIVKTDCIRCGQLVGWVGIAVNLVMVFIKTVVGISSGSKSCLADALHSGSNIVTAFAIFVSRRMTGKPSDEDHPYGHGKIEFIAAGSVSLVIILLTVVLIIIAFKHILYRPAPPPHLSAILVAVMSIITNEMLFRYFRCVGTQLRSQTIIANAWANRADCFSSAAVVIGVLGAQFGFHHLDPIAAVFVALIIVKVSINCIRESVQGLMDKSIPPETKQKLRMVISQIDQVIGINFLRARLLGDKIWIDLGIRVFSDLTVQQCDDISQRIRRNIRNEVQGVGEVFIDYELN
jgi:cation diffusion facilitator family transporter